MVSRLKIIIGAEFNDVGQNLMMLMRWRGFEVLWGIREIEEEVTKFLELKWYVMWLFEEEATKFWELKRYVMWLIEEEVMKFWSWNGVMMFYEEKLRC